MAVIAGKEKTNNYKPGNYLFLVPWGGVIAWWGMLMTMLICWGAQGRPIYHWLDLDHKLGMGLLYISDIGATNLQPLFISLSCVQGMMYCITLALEYFQRCGRWPFLFSTFSSSSSSSSSSKASSTDDSDMKEFDNTFNYEYNNGIIKDREFPFLMPFWFSKDERNLMFASFVFSVIGELCLLMCAIFSTRHFHTVHITMVSLFLVFLAISVILSGTQYIIMGKHYRTIHPQHKFWNKYIISGIWKECWVLTAILWAALFGGFKQPSLSAVFEWLLAFWYGLIFITFSIDFYLGGRYKYSKNFPYVESFQGFYKYDLFFAKDDKGLQTDESTAV